MKDVVSGGVNAVAVGVKAVAAVAGVKGAAAAGAAPLPVVRSWPGSAAKLLLSPLVGGGRLKRRVPYSLVKSIGEESKMWPAKHALTSEAYAQGRGKGQVVQGHQHRQAWQGAVTAALY